MRKPFKLLGDTIEPGTKHWKHLSVGNLADGTPIELAYAVYHGVSEGPTVYVQAACHGDEINGVEALRRVVHQLDPAEMAGTLLVVPVANPLAFTHSQAWTPFDRENMNRVWPGKPDGGISERIAFALWSNLAARGDYLIDLHTGYSTMVTHTVFMQGKDDCKEMARVFGAPVLLLEELDEEWEQKRFTGKLRNVATSAGIVAICPELGGRSKFEPIRVQQGQTGVMNVLRWLKMVKGSPQIPDGQRVVRNHLTRMWANSGGIFVHAVEPGQFVNRGDLVGTVYNLAGFEVVEEIHAPMNGVIVSYAEDPVIHSGSSVGMIGRYLEEDQL